jgi:hypothetical protein
VVSRDDGANGRGLSARAARLRTPEEVEGVIALFEAIAREEGWQPGDGLRAYTRRSTYFGLTLPVPGGAGAEEALVGGLQLVAAEPDGTLPTHAVWPETPREAARPERVAHVAVLAVSKAWRNRHDDPGGSNACFWRLTAAMWRHCVRSGVRELWLEATPTVLRAYRLLGWPLQVRGDLREHWGEPCYPCSLSVREVGGAIAERAVRSPAYRRVLDDMVGGDRVGGDRVTPLPGTAEPPALIPR